MKLLRTFAWFVFVWTPLTCVVFVACFTDLSSFPEQYKTSLIIAETCSAFSFWGGVGIEWLQFKYFQRRGWTFVERTAAARMLHGALFVIPGMYVGFALAGIDGTFGDYRTGIVFGALTSAVFLVLALRKEARLAEQRTEALTLKAQVATLTAQMNPHLRFNSLNSIASTIATHPEQAEAMTLTLSALYRQALAASKRETHALAAELDLVRAYLSLEVGRFGERLRFSIDLAPELAARSIPVLSVQPFVENAVKHGLLARKAGGSVWVKAAPRAAGGVEIIVEDDGVGIGQARPSSGSGTAVANCRERLRLLYGNEAGVALEARAGGGTVVRIVMP
jgi:two-component sensor histidine kinase